MTPAGASGGMVKTPASTAGPERSPPPPRCSSSDSNQPWGKWPFLDAAPQVYREADPKLRPRSSPVSCDLTCEFNAHRSLLGCTGWLVRCGSEEGCGMR